MSHDLLAAMTVPFDEFLLGQGFSRQFVEEIAEVAARVNYGQTPADLHGFVGLFGLSYLVSP